MRGNLNDNQAKIDNADKAVRAALERKRKIIMQSKQIAYDMLSELYGKDGQELVDAVTAEHGLIRKFTDSGMSYADIEGLVDSSMEKRLKLIQYMRMILIPFKIRIIHTPYGARHRSLSQLKLRNKHSQTSAEKIGRRFSVPF